MNKVRRTLLIGMALAPLAARAQGRPPYVELNPPLPVETQNKIEVLEFFWYGCIHCYHLEPKLESWLKTLPKDVEFRRVPAVFGDPRWAHDAAIFFTFEIMGLLPKLHRPFFDAIHRDRLRTDDPKALYPWLESKGVDVKKFEATARSFGVQSKTKRAQRMSLEYQIDGTPAMAVQGRYTVPSSETMLETVNQLVGAIRKNK